MFVTIQNRVVWLNYSHLYYFKTIATEGSIAKASKVLNLGQPTLSAQLKQFEESLGVPLFERFHKRLYLTEPGKIILRYANEIFKTGTEMVEAIQDRLLPGRVHVQIGALDSVPKHVVLEVINTAYAIGRCSVSVLDGSSDVLLADLLQHKIDLLISNFVPSSVGLSGLYSKRIGRTPVVVCGAKKFKDLKKNFPESLNEKPFILPTKHSKLRHDIDHYFLLNNLKVDLIAEAQDMSIQKLMGLEGMGLIPVPLPAAKEYLGKNVLYEIGVIPDVYEELFLITTSRKIENPISSKLIKSFQLVDNLKVKP